MLDLVDLSEDNILTLITGLEQYDPNLESNDITKKIRLLNTFAGRFLERHLPQLREGRIGWAIQAEAGLYPSAEAKKKQKKIELKEIKLRPVTEVHDYTFKIKNAQKFLAKGDKVKFTIRFKGRELQHSHLGNELMDKIKQDMQDIGRVELQPKFDGKQMIMVIQPL